MRKEGFGAEFRFERSSVNAARLKPELGDTTSDEKKHDVDSLSSIWNGGEGRGEEARSILALCLIGNPSPWPFARAALRGEGNAAQQAVE